ncbi:glycosyltransferase family 4 protein [uncultured Parabacteroides sp.]|uniref:glycosyltransferase family 4 protein n=1 Tax=uncultured Parabacteroides sp. TaxID=512312 RepID=UPI00261CE487|nr:glycosyltransferase family 4 protein [uncultured Parabacteroides sp.]
MNILILNTSELTGGAAVAASRLVKALDKSGVEVSMLVRDRKTDHVRVFSVNNSWISRKLNFLRFVWERLIIFICNFFSKENLFQVSIADTGTNLLTHPLVRKADVIHLHWVNQGFLSLSDIKKLVDTGKPIVWTMHDLWPATAICHYPGGCEKYISSCRRCPMLRQNPFFDLAASVFKKKGKVGLSKVTFVGCSRWIMEEAKKGHWLRTARFTSIPNPIDVAAFKPIDKQVARKRLGLPEDKSLLLFAAAKLSDTRKGAIFLIEACRMLKEKYQDRMEIVLMGNSSEELISQFPFKVNTLGYISDTDTMVSAYASADMFIIPSLEDNLPNTIMESMACGTPCAGFETGGIPEMIDHLRNGYVAKYKDARDLAVGIEWILDNNVTLGLSSACVDKVRESYAEEVVAKRYISLYKQVCDRKN